jgi:hypothetical protein
MRVTFTLMCDFHIHACDFDTLRVKLLYHSIHKPYLQTHARGRLKNYHPHACQINTLHGIVTVPYCVSI